ncbi:hypothetical protein POM88_023805 [Heracleum sosnowskyi]|uniref:Nodulin-like domain-containing protein n=1 Tax=Heracleum sosnowskyi TaxID=360622 RepID=A0AAD8MQS7_9APIA|nr:hypothetical protein POM88_023805 [Heracleum sosnowskyi]
MSAARPTWSCALLEEPELDIQGQRLSALIKGIAKDLGDAIGYVAGTLSEILPIWAVLAIAMDLDICGTNGETYFKTGSVVTCIQNFPEHRGPIVGILKEFAGLNGANYEFMTQVYININLPNEAALIFVFALWSSMVITALMFILKPVGGYSKSESEVPSSNANWIDLYHITSNRNPYSFGFYLKTNIFSRGEPSPLPWNTTILDLDKTFGLFLLPGTGFSIWNFLGRVAGCYFSEIVRRKYAYPRTVAMAVVQVLMPIALCSYTMVFPEQLLMGVGYGSHWAIAPAAASDLSGLKSFGALYNFLTLSIPSGTLFLSDVISAGKYDSEAEKQASISTVAKSRTNAQNAASLIVVCRTKKVYAELYGNSRQ